VSIQVILKAIMLRRLKTAELNGKRILNLPERTVTVVNCTFDHDERTFYRALAERTALTMSKVCERDGDVAIRLCIDVPHSTSCSL
jgi:SNF2 family DNA or RNA helicase